MRTHGTLTRWNDDRGFGFIAPAKGPPEVFVHISAFPREGGRPRLNELISFEVAPGKDGKPRALRVMRTAQPAAAPSRHRKERTTSRISIGSGVLVLIILAVVGYYVWSRLHRGNVRMSAQQHVQAEESAPAPTFTCDGRTMCSQMNSCEEATYFLHNCPNTKMDGDGDGRACEDRCGH